MQDASGFDRHPDVDYYDIKQLYFGTYPYKVVLAHRLVREKAEEYIDTYKLNEKYAKAKLRFLKARRKWLPTHSEWKFTDNGSSTFSFFFVHEEDALLFIQKSRKYVAHVHRPHTPKAVDILKELNDGTTTIKTKIADLLYWNTFRYCIEFRRPFGENDLNRLREWFETYYPSDEAAGRAFLSGDFHPRLYLQTETDVVFAKLGVNDLISNIYKVLLKKEIVS